MASQGGHHNDGRSRPSTTNNTPGLHQWELRREMGLPMNFVAVGHANVLPHMHPQPPRRIQHLNAPSMMELPPIGFGAPLFALSAAQQPYTSWVPHGNPQYTSAVLMGMRTTTSTQGIGSEAACSNRQPGAQPNHPSFGDEIQPWPSTDMDLLPRFRWGPSSEDLDSSASRLPPLRSQAYPNGVQQPPTVLNNPAHSPPNLTRQSFNSHGRVAGDSRHAAHDEGRGLAQPCPPAARARARRHYTPRATALSERQQAALSIFQHVEGPHHGDSPRDPSIPPPTISSNPPTPDRMSSRTSPIRSAPRIPSLTSRSQIARLRAFRRSAPGQITRGLVKDFVAGENLAYSESEIKEIENTLQRQLRALAPAGSSKLVVPKAVQRALKTASLHELPADERTCTICYTDYGTVSPEGIVEMPTKLPSCSHIFGSRCLQTWFQQSHKCPYCRSELPSEPSWFAPAARQLLRRILHVGMSGIVRPPRNHLGELDSSSRQTGQNGGSSQDLDPGTRSPVLTASEDEDDWLAEEMEMDPERHHIRVSGPPDFAEDGDHTHQWEPSSTPAGYSIR